MTNSEHFANVNPRCPHCLDDGIVCEEHPDFPWEVKVEGHDGTASGHGAGMPCPYCCSPIPEDGTTSIVEAFTPDWKRAARGRTARGGCWGMKERSGEEGAE